MNASGNQMILKILMLTSLLGYGKANSHRAIEDSVIGKPSSPPNSREILAATAPDYIPMKGSLQECLGRLVFDAAEEIEWPTFYFDGAMSQRGFAFSKNVHPATDEMRYGTSRIKVFGPLEQEEIDVIRHVQPENIVLRLSALIAETGNEIALLRRKNKLNESETMQLENGVDSINMWERRITELRNEYSQFNPGVPNSEGYTGTTTLGNDDSVIYSKYWAHLLRDKYMFVFESTEALTAKMDRAKHKQQFTALLNKFRTRKPYEIPTDLGVCIPHGFIADDGRTTSDLLLAVRYRETPGVIYTIHTGSIGKRGTKATWFTALATAAGAASGVNAGRDDKPTVSARIGPRSFPMGGLKGSQGGFAFRLSPPGKESFEVYDVYTGYSGWLGTDVLPYIEMEMTSRTMKQAPELKQNPPPFKQSMARFEALLKSVRLRPTNPLMPDLANLPAEVRSRVPRPR